MGSKVESKKVAGLRSAATAADADIQIRPYKNGYLIKGAITASNPELEDFATWNEQLGAWYITRRRAYEYDHHYGLNLFSR